jgi:hypothetical protein
MRRGSGWAQLLGAVCAVGGLAASACGSRSGLDELIVILPGDGGANDAGADVAADAPGPPPDGTTDGPSDAPSSLDAPVDAPPDVHRPRDAGPDVFIPPNCSSPSIQYIYIFTDSNHIWSLFPQNGTVALVGTINCTSNGTPFSMAVDRNGSAYVLYRNGAADGTSAMFHVSLRTLKCTPTSWVSPGVGTPFDTFGMGFVGDSNGLTDTLYVAGATSPATLGKLDLGTFAVTTVGSLGAGIDSPELSGALDGRLFAFYATGSTSAVDQIDPASLKHLATYTFSNLPQVSGSGFGGWAFGFWGGDFYLFTAPGNLPGGAQSLITRYRPNDGSQTNVATLDETIVGAGVSTCAPQM